MLGAIIGDIVGSRFEWNNNRTKEFEFLTQKCFPTDDSIMTLALARAVLISKADRSDLPQNAADCMRSLGRLYPDCGYGRKFRQWIFSEDPKAYHSFGNGAAMRVSAAGFAAASLEEAGLLARKMTEVTHDHPEGLKGAEATAAAIYMARAGSSIAQIRDYIRRNYYPMDFTLDGIRDTYEFDATCQGTVPQALEAFFESVGFEDAIRNAVSIGGDSDTLAAICGGVAEAYYGIPAAIREHALTYLDQRLLQILTDFEGRYPPVAERPAGGAGIPALRSAARQTEDPGCGAIAEGAAAAGDDVPAAAAAAQEAASRQLFDRLFEACTILRGPINQDEFKSYVIPILFFKRICDIYDEEYEDALAFSGGDREYAQAEEMHAFTVPEGCRWRDIRQTKKNVGKAIVKAMAGIEKANPETLSGVFSSFDDATWTDRSKLPDQRLKNLIEHMSQIRMDSRNCSADIMGNGYELLIRKFADMSRKNPGEFYTPRPVVRLMVDLLDPRPGETVYDPACGTGGMLIEAIRHMHSDRLAYGRIFGQESSLSTAAMARMNLYLHGAKDIQIMQGDTLRNPLFLDGGRLQTFDCVLANPPFGMEKWGAAQFESDPYGRNIWGCPADSSADFAWLQHMVKSMDPEKGRCAVVLPQGVLFHSGREGTIRRQLIDSDLLEAVITLASGVFYSTGISACILLLRSRKSRKCKGRVCLIDGSGIYTPKRAQNELSPDDVKTLHGLYANYRDVTGTCKIVTLQDLADGGFDLSVKRYMDRKAPKSASPAAVRQNYFDAVEAVRAAEETMRKLLVEGGYVHE